MSAGTIETRHASASTLWLHFFALEDCVLYVHSARSYNVCCQQTAEAVRGNT